MPSVDVNKQLWGETYDWASRGEEWSGAWGGSFWQWYWSIRPRLFDLLPASDVVEIAPGFGRWTEYLRRECQNLIGVDLSLRCVEACQKRFSADSRMKFRETDGTTLTQVADGSVDLVFSFDSLVHAEEQTIEGYVQEIRRVLRPTGAAFIHHSNLGAIESLDGDDHGRAYSMSGERMAQFAERNKLIVSYQELIPWGSVQNVALDAITILSAESGRGPSKPFTNLEFISETRNVARMAALSPLGDRRAD